MVGEWFIKNSFEQEKKGNGFRFKPHIADKAEIASAITTREGGQMDDNFIMYIDHDSSRFAFESSNPKAVEIYECIKD